MVKRRVWPADERLDSRDFPATQIELRLVVERELAGVDGLAQLLGEVQPVSALEQVVLVERVCGCTELRSVHRHIGTPDQGRAVGRVVGCDGDADARTELRTHGVERKRSLQGGVDLPSHAGCRVAIGIHQQDREPVTPDARKDVGRPQCLNESVANLFEDLVTGGMPE